MDRSPSEMPFAGITSHIETSNWGTLATESALAREAALLRGPLEGVCRCIFWQPASPAVVLGKGLVPEKEVHLGLARADGVPVLVRFSGGGAVYLPANGQDGTVLCTAFVLPVRGSDFQAFPLKKVYELGAEVLCGTFMELGVEAHLAGTSDIAVGDLKIAGSAQCRRKHAVLYHASILIRTPVEGMKRYLRTPADMPEYRQARPHREFVTDLSDITGRDDGELLEVLPGLIERSLRAVLGL